MFNIFKFIIISLVFASIYQLPYSGILLTCMIGFLAIVYYNVVFLSMSGVVQNTISIEDSDEVKNNVVTVLSNITGVITVYLTTSYGFVALMAVPWVTISFLTLVFSLLVYYGVLEVGDIEEDQEEDDEDCD